MVNFAYIGFAIILTPINEAVADDLHTHTFKDGLMAHWGWGKIFTAIEEKELKSIQFVEETRIPELKGTRPTIHFGWGGCLVNNKE